MTYINRTPNHYYSMPLNPADYNETIAQRPDFDNPNFHIAINVKSSDSQMQNDLAIVGATAWQLADAITIDPSGGAPTTYTFDSVGGIFHPGQNNFPIFFGLIDNANDHFESNGSGIDAYNFMGKGKALDSAYVHTHDLHAMDSNSVFDSGRAFDMFLNERTSNKLINFESFDLIPKNHIDRFTLSVDHLDSNFGPYPGNRIEISPTQPNVFPIGYDSDAIAAGGGGGGPVVAADPESWS